MILPALQFSGGYEAQAVGYNAQQRRAPLYPLVTHHAADNLIGQVLADLVCNITHFSIKSEKIPANHFAHIVTAGQDEGAALLFYLVIDIGLQVALGIV